MVILFQLQLKHNEMTSNHIGQRLAFDGTLCTVRYIGPVIGTQKDWLGVEWDDPKRGKHDGEHQGKKYFTCKPLGIKIMATS